jgi:serine/threonine protein kinase
LESQDQAQQQPSEGPPGFRPEIFGKYYLLDRIAIGGMAEVFRAKTFGHSGFEKLLVIKRILGHYAQSADFEAMFVDEAKLSVDLVQANIVHIYDFGKIESNLFIAMEAVDGKNLKSVMRRLAEREERMPVRTAVYIAHEIAKGLDYAHRKTDGSGEPLRIVHRDISPANVLLSYEGAVKIVDFGIARAESTRPEAAGVVKGKFQYMSPEQAAGTALDHRSDLFSAGICLWEMLTGNRLFKRATEEETLAAIAEGTVPLPSSFNPAVPSELDRAVLRALALDPDQRYPDGATLQRDLQDFLLPDTPDRLAPILSTLLRDRFQPEIEAEKARLERATALASDLHYGGELDLEFEEDDVERPLPTLESIRPVAFAPPSPAPPKKKERPLAYLLPTILLLAAAFGLWQLQSSAPTGGTLTVGVSPPEAAAIAKITLDDRSIGDRVEDVAPDLEHVLRVAADGFVPKDMAVELVAGQVYAVQIELQALEPEPEPTPEPTPKAIAVAPPRRPPPAAETPAPALKMSSIAFESDPEGARLFLDGRPVGRTPFIWNAPDPETVYNVEFRLPGHKSAQAVARSPELGDQATVYRELVPKQNVTLGRLSVTALPGWARVYINGEFVKTTPLFEHELKPGGYSLRLTNERLGVDIEDHVSIEAGTVTRKSYRLDE